MDFPLVRGNSDCYKDSRSEPVLIRRLFRTQPGYTDFICLQLQIFGAEFLLGVSRYATFA
jgi:hypothetical protein